MEIAEHIEILRDEGQRFAAVAVAAGFDARVPACPGWTVRELVRHTGGVHRWACRIVAELRQSGEGLSIEDEAAASPEDDTELMAWFAAGHRALVAALQAADPAVDFWRFMRKAPSSLAFWARRQSHETAMHRVDADGARGGGSAPFPPVFAADGIDELLLGFAARRRPPIEPERTLLLTASDVPRWWHVTLGAEGVVTVTQDPAVPGADGSAVAASAGAPAAADGAAYGAAPGLADGAPPDPAAPALAPAPVTEPPAAELRVTATADRLCRLLWNRLEPPDGLELDGDAGALTVWRATVAVV